MESDRQESWEGALAKASNFPIINAHIHGIIVPICSHNCHYRQSASQEGSHIECLTVSLAISKGATAKMALYSKRTGFPRIGSFVESTSPIPSNHPLGQSGD